MSSVYGSSVCASLQETAHPFFQRNCPLHTFQPPPRLQSAHLFGSFPLQRKRSAKGLPEPPAEPGGSALLLELNKQLKEQLRQQQQQVAQMEEQLKQAVGQKVGCCRVERCRLDGWMEEAG